MNIIEQFYLKTKFTYDKCIKKSPYVSLVRQDPTVSCAQGPKIASYATGTMSCKATKPLNATSCDCTVSTAAVGGTHPTSHVSSSSLGRYYENKLMIRGMSSRSTCINSHNGSLILLD